jgi:hypothetical protein
MHGIVCIVSSGHYIEQDNYHHKFWRVAEPPGGHFQNFLWSGCNAAPESQFGAVEARQKVSPETSGMRKIKLG